MDKRDYLEQKIQREHREYSASSLIGNPLSKRYATSREHFENSAAEAGKLDRDELVRRIQTFKGRLN